MSEAYIIDACRTPRGIGKVGKGALADIHPQQLAATVLKALAKRNDINTEHVDDIVWGTSSQRGKQAMDMGRMAALDAGYSVKASGMTLDRFCGSGITAVNIAASSILSGMEDLVIAGGTEMMSYTSSSAAAADPKTGPMLMDAGNMRLRARHPQTHQGVCADAIATLEGIPRQALDELALVSQQRADAAIKAGHFKKSLVPVYKEDGTLALDHEEFPRPQTTLEGLLSLKPSFEAMAEFPFDQQGTTLGSLVRQVYPDLKIKHVHHAGNSSGVVDGAAALLLASPAYAKKHGLKPRARIVAWANMGDSPTLMLNAPVPAVKLSAVVEPRVVVPVAQRLVVKSDEKPPIPAVRFKIVVDANVDEPVATKFVPLCVVALMAAKPAVPPSIDRPYSARNPAAPHAIRRATTASVTMLPMR